MKWNDKLKFYDKCLSIGIHCLDTFVVSRISAGEFHILEMKWNLWNLSVLCDLERTQCKGSYLAIRTYPYLLLNSSLCPLEFWYRFLIIEWACCSNDSRKVWDKYDHRELLAMRSSATTRRKSLNNKHKLSLYPATIFCNFI